MKIIKQPYSRWAWRLVTSEGKEVTWRRPFDHPDLGATFIEETIAGDTKQECVDKALQALEMLMTKNKRPS